MDKPSFKYTYTCSYPLSLAILLRFTSQHLNESKTESGSKYVFFNC